MSKINYSQAEEGMNEAIRKMRMKKLQEGKPVTSDRAVEFYNLSLEERSLPQDPVEQLLESESGPQQDVEGEYEEAGQVVDSVKQEESIAKIRPAKTKAPSAVPYSKDIDAKSIAQPEAVSPLLILRKHIFWLKTKNMEERYALIGTSKPEIFALRKKKELSQKDLQRIAELNSNAERVRQELLKKEAKATDTELIDEQKKSQKNKRLSVRDRWLKL